MSANHHLSLAATGWSKPAAAINQPGEGEIHLWRIALPANRDFEPASYTLLSPDERTRADRFYYDEDRSAFIYYRSCLRLLLGNYLGAAPEKIEFAYGEYGKPLLLSAAGNDLSFNVSHSGKYGLIGVAAGNSIGVDLEVDRSEINIQDLAPRFFAPAECYWVLSDAQGAQRKAFFRTWTRKEAFLKAHGRGLSLPLDQFVVTVAADQPTRIETIAWEGDDVADWSLRSFTVAPGLPGAVVLRGPIRAIRYLDWAESSDGHPSR